jgi:hypothetical protein
MKPKRNEQIVAALLAVSVALTLLASVDLLAQREGRPRVELANSESPAMPGLMAGAGWWS